MSLASQWTEPMDSLRHVIESHEAYVARLTEAYEPAAERLAAARADSSLQAYRDALAVLEREARK